jgi:hypothetical protein
VTERLLALRREVMRAFAAAGTPPAVRDRDGLRSLAEHHVVVLDEAGAIVMAHPFAAPGAGTIVEAGGRTWWGSCAWDGLGIVAALGLDRAIVRSNGLSVSVESGRVTGDAVFHVAVPARRWWDDIAHT